MAIQSALYPLYPLYPRYPHLYLLVCALIVALLPSPPEQDPQFPTSELFGADLTASCLTTS